MHLRLDHIALRTNSLDNTIRWYEDYFSCKKTWHKSSEDLPIKIRDRFPYVSQVVELQVSEVRFHIFEMVAHYELQPEASLHIDHFCVELDTFEELVSFRERWIELFQSGKYTFERDDMPTDIIASSDGMQGFYAHEPNGMIFEAFYLPAE